LRLVSWNILQGGGRRLASVLEAISGWSPDIVTLQEVRGRHVDAIASHLSGIGLRHHYLSDAESDTQNGILIAARDQVEAGDFIEDRDGLCHILEAEVSGMILLPVHFPQKAAQVPLFEALARDPRTGRGFRYDHTLASPSISSRVQSVFYDHSVRNNGFSDHSALIVDLR